MEVLQDQVEMVEMVGLVVVGLVETTLQHPLEVHLALMADFVVQDEYVVIQKLVLVVKVVEEEMEEMVEMVSLEQVV